MSDFSEPAFPSRQDVPHGNGGSHREDYPGMSLRDYFAAQALPAAVTAFHAGTMRANPAGEPAATIAVISYQIADAILAARAPVDPVLTITITGPAGSGKTRWADYLRKTVIDLPGAVIVDGRNG